MACFQLYYCKEQNGGIIYKKEKNITIHFVSAPTGLWVCMEIRVDNWDTLKTFNIYALLN
jgi:hypothetical protein